VYEILQRDLFDEDYIGAQLDAIERTSFKNRIPLWPAVVNWEMGLCLIMD